MALAVLLRQTRRPQLPACARRTLQSAPARTQSQYPSSFLHSERARGPVEPPHPEYFQQPPPPPPPRQRSLAARALWLLFKYGTFTAASVLAGVALGVVSVPPATLAAVQALTSKPPSDEASLALYDPRLVDTDAATRAELARINEHIVQHPLAQALRANPAFRESRPHMKIPEAARPMNLTAGALAGPARISVPPLIFNEDGGRSMVAILHLGDALCGHPGIVHGGLLATLLDEGLARCCFPALPNKMGVTAFLNLDYRKPAMAGRYYVLRAVTERVEGRKAFVKGWIEELSEGDAVVEQITGPGSGISDAEFKARKGRANVEASALFVEPRGAKTMRALRAE